MCPGSTRHKLDHDVHVDRQADIASTGQALHGRAKRLAIERQPVGRGGGSLLTCELVELLVADAREGGSAAADRKQWSGWLEQGGLS